MVSGGGEQEGRRHFPFSNAPIPPPLVPTSSLRGQANRMEVGAGRTGSKRTHWPTFSLELTRGRGFPPRSTTKPRISSQHGDGKILEKAPMVTFSWKVCLE